MNKTAVPKILRVETTRVFNEDVNNLSKKRGGVKSIKDLEEVIDIVLQQKQLPERYRFHKLKGDLKGCLSCHVHNDLCLIWIVDKDLGIAKFLRVGTHSEIYG